ncbi:hypothetical protein [Faecalibaculum rodentium]|uniref:hypothetical protein n=1 Tax=Faecalibaculum rodentium TaxID=1702221 RepID=UPI0023F281DD|nr:hypothetical protein [Faecalibaculum rodentium]
MKNMNLNDFQNAMQADWWICKEDAGELINTDKTMSGWDMLTALREADAWDQLVSATLPGIEVKDLLATLCDVLGIDWQDAEDWQEAYNRLESLIDTVE